MSRVAFVSLLLGIATLTCAAESTILRKLAQEAVIRRKQAKERNSAQQLVIRLDEASFDKFVKENDHVLVKFCNPWSRHCKAFEPEYLKLAEAARTHGLAARLAHIDASTDPELAARLSVTRLPTMRYLKHFKNGHAILEYRGEKTSTALLQWLVQHEEPSLDWEALVEPHVAALTNANFEQHMKDHDKVLVEFYSPGCKHCVAFEPEYEAAAVELKRESRETIFAKIDGIEERALAKQYGIRGYPTLKYFVNGVPSKGPEARDAKGIADWVRNREASRVELVAGADIDAWARSKQFAIVSTGGAATKQAKVFEKVAFYFLDEGGFSFASVAHSTQATLVMHRRGFAGPDQEEVHFNGTWTEGEIQNWILQMSYPAIGEYDVAPERYTPAQGSESFLAVSMVVSLSKEDDVDLASMVESLLLQRVDVLKSQRVQLAWADIGNVTHDDALARRSDNVPQITLLATQTGKLGVQKYVLAGPMKITNDEKLSQFMDEYFKGTLKPAYKSQPVQSIPNLSRSIKTLVGDNFEETAFAEKHDVFVKFYAPWCGQCQRLEPIWKVFADVVEQNGFEQKGVVVAEMDSTLNECVEEVTGYPQLVLYPAVRGGERRKMRERTVHRGQHDVPALLEFLRENARSLQDVDPNLFTDIVKDAATKESSQHKEVQDADALQSTTQAPPQKEGGQCNAAGQTSCDA